MASISQTKKYISLELNTKFHAVYLKQITISLLYAEDIKSLKLLSYVGVKDWMVPKNFF